MRKLQQKNGFSVVEVMVALSIIVVVSFSALTIVVSSLSTTDRAIYLSDANAFADSVWECFKAADDSEEFVDLVKFAEDVDLTDGVDDGNGNKVYTHEFEEGGYTAQITVGFPVGAEAVLSITVTEADGDEIISFSYRKGEGV